METIFQIKDLISLLFLLCRFNSLSTVELFILFIVRYLLQYRFPWSGKNMLSHKVCKADDLLLHCCTHLQYINISQGAERCRAKNMTHLDVWRHNLFIISKKI